MKKTLMKKTLLFSLLLSLTAAAGLVLVSAPDAAHLGRFGMFVTDLMPALAAFAGGCVLLYTTAPRIISHRWSDAAVGIYRLARRLARDLGMAMTSWAAPLLRRMSGYGPVLA